LVVPFTVATLVCVTLLVAAEGLKRREGVWLFKPLASTFFIATALAAGALDSGYGQAVLVALALSWWGDVLLIPKGSQWFRAGLLAFLLGHVAYAVAFFVLGAEAFWVAVALVLFLAVGVGVDRWLTPYVSAGMRVPVRAYVFVISVMVAFAAGAVGAGHPGAILVGAVMFWASDLFVARNRFVGRAFVNRLVGLPLYYGGQLVLAWTVASG
jgi:uncharacterized membrane protein YhhN